MTTEQNDPNALVSVSKSWRADAYIVETTDNPLARLRAIQEMRRLMDELELDAVSAARKRDVPWDDIAEATEVTKQAAHKKWSARLPGAGSVAAGIGALWFVYLASPAPS